jgi:hypothetical protein
MATTVMYVTVRLDIESEKAIDFDTVFSEMSCDFESNLDGIEITDTEITDYEVV